MSKKILLLSGSPRRHGNCDCMCEAFAQGAQEASHTTEIYYAGDNAVKPCLACNACFAKNEQPCAHDEAFNLLAPKLVQADALVVASPLYFFTFPAQLKAVIDKLYAFTYGGRALRIREAYLLACGEESVEACYDPIVTTFRQITDYLQWQVKGVYLATHVTERGDIKQTPHLSKITELGRQA